MTERVLSIENLQVQFKTYAGTVQAIRGVDFQLHKGETLAIVGESGSGKTVTSRAIMRLLRQSATINEGKIDFMGQDLRNLSDKQMEKIRGSQIAMIFQDPMTSLNPTLTIGRQLVEVIIKHRKFSRAEAVAEACNLPKSILRWSTSTDCHCHRLGRGPRNFDCR